MKRSTRAQIAGAAKADVARHCVKTSVPIDLLRA